MIQQATVSVETLWQKELKQSFSRPEDLLSYLDINPESLQPDIAARRLFPMRVPRAFADLMEPGNLNDPLLRQVLPDRAEFEQVPGYVTDPLEEQNNELPGLLHKYGSRVLVIFRGGCAVNCRYCFRRHFPYQDNSVNKAQLLEHIRYIKSHPEVNEVILSGGDPLMANDEQLDWFFNQLEQLPQIKRVRVHSRLPVVIPNRVSPEFVNVMSERKFQLVLVLHINHSNEISSALMDKVKLLKQQGVWVLNQAVLLKGINTTLEQQVSLSERLFDAGIQPYYLFLLDKVLGAAHFDLAEQEAKRLYQGLLAALPGFLVPKLAREIGGEASKTPLLPY